MYSELKLSLQASTVLSARSLFSERHFERRSIQLPKDAQFNYKDFVEQKPLGHRDKGIDCLARGKSTGADKFLDWLVCTSRIMAITILTLP